jgi:hypothetical protein
MLSNRESDIAENAQFFLASSPMTMIAWQIRRERLHRIPRVSLKSIGVVEGRQTSRGAYVE